MSNIRQLVESSNHSSNSLIISTNKTSRKGILLLIAVYVILFLASLPFRIYSQASGAGYAESYILRNVGARANAMSGAYTAISNDPMAIFFNPGGLGFLSSQPSIGTSLSALSFDRFHSSMAYGQMLTDNIGIGFGLNSFNSPSIEGRRANGDFIGNFTDWQYALSLGMAYREESVSLGFALKHLKHNLQGSGVYGNGVALDIGTKINVLDLVSMGIAVQNISGLMIWNSNSNENDVIPYSVRAGVAMEFGLNEESYQERSLITGEVEDVYVPATRYIILSMDLVHTQFRISPDLVIGTEMILHELIAFRGGMSIYGESEGTPQLLPMNYWGGGFSLRPPQEDWELPFRLSIDYTVSKEFVSQAGVMHNISFHIDF